MQIRSTLAEVASDPYWAHGPDAGEAMGALHIGRKLNAEQLTELSVMPRDKLNKNLRQQLAKTRKDLDPEQIRRRADVMQQSLEAAMLLQLDAKMGQAASEALRQVAADFRQLGSNKIPCLARLLEASQLDAKSLEAVLATWLGDEELANGLTIRLKNKPENLIKQLGAGRRAALPQSTVCLQEIMTAMHKTANQLDMLANQLAKPSAGQGMQTLDLCPELAKGLLATQPADSCLAQALTERQADHRRYRSYDHGLKLAGSLLLDVGAVFGGPLLVGASVTYNLGTAAHGAENTMRLGRLRMLGALSAKNHAEHLGRLQTQKNRALGMAAIDVLSTGLPGNALLSEGGDTISRIVAEPPWSRSGQPGDSPAR
ncbi:MAG: hypothetical protein JRF33_00760 [Deltaproteobacteria bacterium]|nr:hypothetical protein [Deltaproteobacteria bacterium]